MASAIKIEVTEAVGGAIGALLATGDASLIGEVRRGMGAALADTLRTHFETLDAERSGKSGGLATGGAGTHFWMQVRDSVQEPRTVGDDLVIGINHVGFRQRLEGGTITAGKGVSSVTGEPTKFLAIPFDSDALGKRPGDFPEGALKYVVIGSLGPALVLAEDNARIATKGKNKGKSVPARSGQEATVGAGSVMFLLRASVTQAADPSVLPPEQTIITNILAAGDEAATLFLDRLADGVKPGNN